MLCCQAIIVSLPPPLLSFPPSLPPIRMLWTSEGRHPVLVTAVLQHQGLGPGTDNALLSFPHLPSLRVRKGSHTSSFPCTSLTI